MDVLLCASIYRLPEWLSLCETMQSVMLKHMVFIWHQSNKIYKTASYPAFLSSTAHVPPELVKVIPPVAGLFETIKCLPLLGVFVPVRGPVANTSRFSAENGSIPACCSSYNILVPRPRPPR